MCSAYIKEDNAVNVELYEIVIFVGQKWLYWQFHVIESNTILFCFGGSKPRMLFFNHSNAKCVFKEGYHLEERYGSYAISMNECVT